jgi:hypothetical protein
VAEAAANSPQAKKPFEELVALARLASLNNSPEESAAYWERALVLANQAPIGRFKLSYYYEDAADDIACTVHRSFSAGGSYSEWQMAPEEHQQSQRDTRVRLELARPFVLKALELTPANADRMRLLDKMATIENALGNENLEEQYLQQRIKGTADAIMPFERLAGILESQGRLMEAERVWKGHWQVETAQETRPFPNAMTKIAEIYERQKQFDKASMMRSRICALIRSYAPEYQYALKEELPKLASCLEHINDHQGAVRALAEAKTIKE